MQDDVIKIGDYNVFSDTMDELLIILMDRVKNEKTTTIVTINPEIYLHSIKNEKHAESIKTADIVIADGVGIVWAEQYLFLSKIKFKILRFIRAWLQILFAKKHVIISQRITGVDLTLELCKIDILPIKIFGSFNGHGQLAKEKMLELYPDLKIEVYEDMKVDAEANVETEILNKLLDKRCLILLALGAPKQELLMQKIKDKVIKGSIIIGVGGTIDFLSGKAKRAPRTFRKLGIEWLFRLITEPKRFKRIINAVIVFPFYIIKRY